MGIEASRESQDRLVCREHRVNMGKEVYQDVRERLVQPDPRVQLVLVGVRVLWVRLELVACKVPLECKDHRGGTGSRGTPQYQWKSLTG